MTEISFYRTEVSFSIFRKQKCPFSKIRWTEVSFSLKKISFLSKDETSLPCIYWFMFVDLIRCGLELLSKLRLDFVQRCGWFCGQI